MKYTININQKSAVDLGLKLDFNDLAILDCIQSYSNTSHCRKIVIDNNSYFWISPKMIIKELPLLGITSDRGINKRIDNLIDAELLERCPDNKSLHASYFRIGAKYSEYVFQNDRTEVQCMEQNVQEHGKKVQSSLNNCSNNNNTINNNTNKKKEIDKSISKKTASLYEIALTEHGVDKDAIKQLLSTLKQKRKDKNNQRALNKLLENIKESGYSVKQAIEIMNEHDWATFEVSYLKSVSAPPAQKQAPKRIHPNYPDWEYCDQSTFKNQIENDVWITGDKKVINGSRTLPDYAYPVPTNYTKWDCQAEEWLCIGSPTYRTTAEEQLANLNKNIRAEKERIQREQEERERMAFKPSF